MGILDFFKKSKAIIPPKDNVKKNIDETDEIQRTHISVKYQLVLKDKSIAIESAFTKCSKMRKQDDCNSETELECVICKKLIELNKYYTRKDIETMSLKLGYSVFDNPGGAVDNEGNPVCNFKWENVILTEK